MLISMVFFKKGEISTIIIQRACKYTNRYRIHNNSRTKGGTQFKLQKFTFYSKPQVVSWTHSLAANKFHSSFSFLKYV